MADLNKVMLIGRAGKDADLRYTANGMARAEFSLAVNNRRRNPTSNDWEDQTEWFNILIWAEQAERVSQYITKGKQLYIEGRFQTRSWDDDQGLKHYRTEVIAQNIQLLGSRNDEGGGGGGSSGGGWNDQPADRGRGGNGGGFSGGASRGGQGGANRPAGGRGSAGPVDDIDDLPFE